MSRVTKDGWWHPNKAEWRALCEIHPEYDPESSQMNRNGEYVPFRADDAPTEEVEKGKLRLKEKQAEEFARTEEEAFEDAVKRDKKRNALIRQQEYREVRGKELQKINAEKKKALTADDPFEASMRNTVDKKRLNKNGNYIIHARRLSELPKIPLSDPDAIRERVDFYFQLCITDGIRPNLPGYALAFGLSRAGLMNALADRRMTRAAAEELGRGIAMLDEILSAMTIEGQIQPIASIYFLNNWLGYKNASEVTTRTEIVESSVDQKALEQKYQTVIDME